MIAPRRTRLVGAPDLAAFRATIAELAVAGDLAAVRARAVLLPSGAAAEQLRRLVEAAARPVALPDLLTRDQWYRAMHLRLGAWPPLLSALERGVIAGAAARDALAAGAVPPFTVRPALVAAILEFYDEVRRHRRTIDDFERLVIGDLEARADLDRGAERMLRQTRFFGAMFRAYEARAAESGAIDEHALRERLLDSDGTGLYRHVVVAVADRQSDPPGLWEADFDLLTRLPGLSAIDVVATENALAAGLAERLSALLPGLEVNRPAAGRAAARPHLVVPPGETASRHFVRRDREAELVETARAIKGGVSPGAAPPLDRIAVVFRRPLPYVYLARTVFDSARVPYETADALPLAAEPLAAAVDLVLTAVSTSFSREALVALLRSPHFDLADCRAAERRATELPESQSRRTEQRLGVGRDLEQPEAETRVPGLRETGARAGGAPSDDEAPFAQADDAVGRSAGRAVAAVERALDEAGFLGGRQALERLSEQWTGSRRRLADRALAIIDELSPLLEAAPASTQVSRLDAFLRSHERLPVPGDAWRERHLRARGAILAALSELANAHRAHDDPPMAVDELAATVRRWMETETFRPRTGTGGVRLLDADAAPFADLDETYLVGLVGGEWPGGARRNIFYPPFLLVQLGWPPESTRLAATRAAFADLVASPRRRVTVSTFSLEEDALVEPSPLLEELDRAELESEPGTTGGAPRILQEEALVGPVRIDALCGAAAEWAEVRIAPRALPWQSFRGSIGAAGRAVYNVSALDEYLECPFRYFAAEVMEIEEPEDASEGLSRRDEGRLAHEVLRAFFDEWQRSGRGAVRPESLDQARRLFAAVAERELAKLSEADQRQARASLFGTAVAPGVGEAALLAEAHSAEQVDERLFEHALDGEYDISDGARTRRLALRARADRIDLLPGRRIRVIDYKLGRADQAARSIQLPTYAVCARSQLERRRGGRWDVAEAAYLAFGRPNPVRALVPARSPGQDPLGDGQRRLLDVVEGIERGQFPPRPIHTAICRYCGYARLCRKEYVDEVDDAAVR